MDKLDLKQVKKNHSVTMDNREKLTLSGVERVINSADTFINLVSSQGGLEIKGRNFKIEKFNIDDGSLVLSGNIDSLRYSAAKISLLKRLFR